jgi:pimeloyl-ACP methyl ester carboxylesterase
MARKHILRIGGVIGLFVLFTQLTSGCFQFRMDQSEVTTYFKDIGKAPELQTIQVNGRRINYADTKSDSLPMVVFFHGAPGSWSAFIDFLADEQLYSQFRLLSVDRPGYGYSDFGEAEPDLEKQAELFKPILEMNQSDKLPILVGHSLGGPVIAKMAMLYPDLIGGIIMVAPSIAPDLEPEEAWRGPLRNPMLRWLIPTSMRVTNEEIFFLKDELKRMMDGWKTITCDVIVIQGSEDGLVDPENAAFAKNMLTQTDPDIRYFEDVNHFIPWNNPQLIKTAILNMDENNDISANF